MRALMIALAEGGRYLFYIAILVLFLIVASFFRCASAPLSQSATVENQAAIDGLKDELKTATPAKAKVIKQAIDALQNSTKTIDSETKRADKNEKSAAEFRALKWCAAGVLALAAAFFGVKKFLF